MVGKTRTLLISALLSLTGWAQPTPLPDMSGLAPLSDGRLVTVVDRKGTTPEKLASEVRLALLDFKGKGPLPHLSSTPVKWPDPPAADLEGITPVPGRVDTFFVTESGARKPFRRIFVMHWNGQQFDIEATLALPEIDQEIEGITCLARADGQGYQIFLGGRQAADGGAGRLYWGSWQWGQAQVQWSARSQPLCSPQKLGSNWRSCSDLWLDKSGRLWVSAAADGSDQGPFNSLIYSPGKLRQDWEAPLLEESQTHCYQVHGFKVEGICVGPKENQLWMVSDDEDFGGAIRPLEIAP